MNTVKYKAKIETPTEYTGYLVDGKMSVPLVEGNRHYKEVQEWIAEGNTPEAPFTQAELDAYANSQLEAQLTAAIDAIVVDYSVNGTIYQFGGSLATQERINTGIAKAKNKNKELNWFTIDRQKVKLTAVDLSNILDLIDEQQEAILDTV